MARMFETGDAVSPSGCVVMDDTGRRGRIARRPMRLHCTWCGGHVTVKRRTTWCSQECVDLYMATQPAVYRSAALERAGHCCQLCGKSGCALDVDHEVPIIEGGHPFDPDNLRALCLDCHTDATSALATRRADARREARGEGLQVDLFSEAAGGQL